MVTEVVENVGFFDRMKEACAGVLFGMFLVAVCAVAQFWNESRYVTERDRIDTAERLLKSDGAEVKSDAVDAKWEGKLVHTSGTAKTDAVLRDAEFGLAVNAFRLERDVEMYQWKQTEKTTDKGKTKTYTYSQVWSSSLIDSSSFKEQAGHQNPSSMPYQELSARAPNGTLGAFVLDEDEIASIGGLTAYQVDGAAPAAMPTDATPTEPAATTPANPNACPECGKELKSEAGVRDHMQAKHGKEMPAAGSQPQGNQGRAAASSGGPAGFKKLPDGFYKGGNPNSPVVGDVKVTYTYVPPSQEISIIAQQRGSGFEPMPLEGFDPWHQVVNGIMTAVQMFEAKRKANTMILWLIRIGGFILMGIGFGLIFKPVTVMANVIPIVGSLVEMGLGFVGFGLAAVLSFFAIALGWIFARPLVGLLLLAVGVGILVGLIVLAKSMKGGGEAAAPAAA